MGYQEITGETVPYRRFNFSSLDAFLESIPDVCRMSRQGGNLMVNLKGVGTPETKHIEDLVQGKWRGVRRGGDVRMQQPVVVNHPFLGPADDSGVDSDFDDFI